MCGRYTLAQPNDIYDRFEIEHGNFDLRPNYNVAPSFDMPIITQDRQLQIMTWGYVPPWETSSKPKLQPINARDDSLSTKPFFKKAFLEGRCIVPATGFYEWKKEDDGAKTPYYIHLKDEDLFGFAGLYSIWKHPSGKEIPTYLIISTRPNKLMDSIHNRMPVILKKDLEQDWLNPDITEAKDLIEMLTPYPDDLMEAYEISKRVNNPGENDERLIFSIS